MEERRVKERVKEASSTRYQRRRTHRRSLPSLALMVDRRSGSQGVSWNKAKESVLLWSLQKGTEPH